MTYQETLNKEITTSNTERPSSPQITLPNPLDDDIFVNGIELLLTPEFARKGKLIILVNETPVLSETTNLQKYHKLPIPLGKVLRRSSDIQIFAWNKTDSNEIKLELNIYLGKNKEPMNSQAVPMSETLVNDVVSEPVTLFPKLTRDGTSETNVIDMKGYKKLIVNMSAQDYTSPTVIENDGTWANQANAIDGDLATQAILQIADMEAGDTDTFTVDFGSIALRKPTAKVGHDLNTNLEGNDHTITSKLYVSDDDVSYTEVDTRTDSAVYPADVDVTFTLSDVAQSFRYLRVQSISAKTGTNRGAIRIDIDEMYDGGKLGGTGTLSFEIKNSVTDEWQEYIASSEFGTISDGVTAIVEQIGDNITKSVSGKTYILPSTQDNFRAKYAVTGGGLTNAISIIKVS